MDDTYKGLVEETGIKFVELKTEKELREFITSRWYDLDEEVDWGLYCNERFVIENLENHGKTPDEIWEFF